MKLIYCSILVLASIMYSSCQKSLSFEQHPENPHAQHTPEFQASIPQHHYRLAAFYADKPIDFITTDSVVRSETDLWNYVPDYLKDDEYVFNADSTFTIYQHALKCPTNNVETITARYSIVKNGNQVIMNFVDYRYEPLQYKLDTFNDSYFILYVPGPDGSTLYSKFIRLQ